MSNRSFVIGWQRRWNRSLFQFLGRRVRATVDIEDLAQETYLRLLRARDLTDVRNPRAYLLRVARHVVAEWRVHQLPEAARSSLDEDMLEGMNNVELEFYAEISQALLDETLLALPAIVRAVLLLRFREEYTYKEIAAKLELTERQVRRHLTRGYEHLRKTLKS